MSQGFQVTHCYYSRCVLGGPGLCYPGLFYLFSLDSVVPSFAVKNFNLFYPLLQLAVPSLMLRIILSLAIPEET